MMWNALRKKVNKSNRSYQLSDSHNQSESEDSDSGSGSATKVVLRRYTKISSCSENLADTTSTSADADAVLFTPRYENPYATLDATTALAKPHGRGTDASRWSTVDNARHLLLSDTSHDASADLRNNNRADDDVMRRDDLITADEHPDGNANHFGTAKVEVTGKVSPPRLKRREKTSLAVVLQRRDLNGDDLSSVTCQRDDVTLTGNISPQNTSQGRDPDTNHVVVPGSLSTGVTADDEESGYSTLRDILGQVERAVLEQQRHQQQQHQLQTLAVMEDHADSDLDTSGDCRDIDLEQAGRSKSTDDCQMSTAVVVSEQPSTPSRREQSSATCDEKQQQQLSHEEADRCSLIDVNRNRAELTTEASDVVQPAGELPGAVTTNLEQVTHNYDVPRSTPVRGLRDQDDGKCHGARKPRPPPPPPPSNDENIDDASSTPLDGTPRSQASCSTLTQQQCEPASASMTDDNLIRVELSGDMLTVSEPTHMSWEEVLQSAHVLGIPLQPQRPPPPPAIMTRSDSVAVRRSSTSSSVTSSERSFVSSPMNSPGARCRTSAPPVVLPRHLITRRTVSSSPSTKQSKPKKNTKGASPFREKLHNLFARKGDDHQQKERGLGSASPTDSHRRSCSDRTRQRDRRDDVDCSRRPPTSGDRISSRISTEVSPSAAELINCGYRESMLSVLSSSFSSGSLGSIFSHASSSISSNSSSAAAHRQYRHQYHHQQSSSSSSSSAWRNNFAG